MLKTNEELYREREKRVTDTIAFNMPDRVPVMLELSYFPAKYTGITCEAAYYDYDRWLDANRKTVRDFEPDLVWVYPFFPGAVYDLLKPRQLILPGHGISPHHAHRFLEGEFMKADEYEAFMEDRTDFMLRYFLPRIMGALEPFNKLPPFFMMTHDYIEATSLAESLAAPEIINALETLLKAGRVISDCRGKMSAFGGEIEKLGFPLHGTITVSMPFDVLSYHFRGLHGIYMDMFRQPEKLLEALDSLLKTQIKKAIMKAERGGRKRVFFALHRGADDFMSPEQFDVFYWPSVKKLVQAMVDRGYTPCLFLEGNYTSRLEHFLELPKGKVLGRFDASDLNRAKEILHGHMCIMGDVPSVLLQIGTPDEVEEYCKKLIDVVGKDGGLIVAPRSSIDEARPENIKRMVDVTKEYGRY